MALRVATPVDAQKGVISFGESAEEVVGTLTQSAHPLPSGVVGTQTTTHRNQSRTLVRKEAKSCSLVLIHSLK